MSGHQCPHASCCHLDPAPTGVHQTLDEMDFERGIWSAAGEGDLNRVVSQLNKGTDPNKTDASGYTGLHYASRNGHEAVCRALLSHGALVNAQTPGGATALSRAAYCGHATIVSLLFKHGADCGLRDSDGMTALHKVAEGGHLSVCKLLVQQQPDLKDIVDNKCRKACDLLKEDSELKALLSTG
ncbi:ankyrin repeat domain-containing protein 39 [Lampetra fluviatilis]